MKRRNSYLILAPAGSGKTTFVLGLMRTTPAHFLYLSPLKALNLEFYERCEAEGIKIQGCWTKAAVKKWAEKKPLSFQSLVSSSECLGPLFWKAWIKLEGPKFVVFDEIHLFDMWGHSFRPALIETLLRSSSSDSSIIAMTATAGGSFLAWWTKHMVSEFSESFIVNTGNMKIAKLPKHCFVFNSASKHLFWKAFFLRAKSKRRRTLLFVPYREQVLAVEQRLKRENVKVLSCLGGQSLEFKNSLKKLEGTAIDCIVATSVLGHGVNLPEVLDVFIVSSNLEEEMWLQMAARGGRRGTSFDVYSFQAPKEWKVRWGPWSYPRALFGKGLDYAHFFGVCFMSIFKKLPSRFITRFTANKF